VLGAGCWDLEVKRQKTKAKRKLGFGIWNLGFGVGCWVLGPGSEKAKVKRKLGFGIWDLEFGIWDLVI